MKTVAIEPAVAYVNGKQMIATSFNVMSVSDNLFDHVIFKYTLFDANGLYAGEASYELNGIEEYSTWFATPEGAFEIVANGIGLTLAPVPEGKTIFCEDK